MGSASTHKQALFVREATTDDLDAIRSIYNHYVGNSTCTFALSEETADERDEWFSAHVLLGLPVLVAEADGAIVGWGSLSSYASRCGYKRTAEISVYLSHDHHGRGFGKTLTDELLRRAVELELHCLLAFICSENTPSLGLFQSRGFIEVGCMKEVGNKFNRWLNVTILEKLL